MAIVQMMAGDGSHSNDDTLLFADHVEARQMGEHVREFHLPKPVALRSVRILGRGQRPCHGSQLEGKTFPDVRAMTLCVYAQDRLSTSSTMPRLRPGEVKGTFVVPGEQMVTSRIVVKGEYLRLSVAMYGSPVQSGETLPEVGHEKACIAPHLQPTAAFESDRLDLADVFAAGGGASGGMDGADMAALPEEFTWSIKAHLVSLLEELDLEADFGVPLSLSRALALGTLPDSNARIAEHADWVSALPDEPGVLEADAIVAKLEMLVRDITQLAQKMPDANAAHISYGPVLARALLALSSRCMERLEFRPLRAALRALAASLCAAPTAAEVLKRGGLAQLLAVLRDSEWSQMSSKVAALGALLQLCSHAVGMEALLGWSSPTDAVMPAGPTGYEVVVSVALDGSPENPQLEQTAVLLLRRAAFYKALCKLDQSCAKLGGSDEAAPIPGKTGEEKAAIEALSEIAVQFEELSREPEGGPSEEAASLLANDAPMAFRNVDRSLNSNADTSADPFATAYPQMHGFLESFAAGRRLVPALVLLVRRLPKMAPLERLAAFAPLRRLICALLACVGGAQFLASDSHALSALLSLLDGSGMGRRSGSKGTWEAASGLPAVPRFPEPLVRCIVGSHELAALITMHVRATRLVLMLLARTRQHGRAGLLPEPEAIQLLSALHQLCVRGSAGRDTVVCAFRSAFLVEWLLRQIDGRLEEALPGAGGTAQLRPTIRHLIAILHALFLGDPMATVAEQFGGRALASASRALELFDTGADTADAAAGAGGGAGTWGRPQGASLEFALESEGPDGGLGLAVRLGRRSADTVCSVQLRELVAQLKPWQQGEGDQPALQNAAGVTSVSTGKLMASLQNLGAPRALKRSTNEEQGTKLSLSLGGYTGAGTGGVEIPEADFGVGGDAGGEHAEGSDKERFPAGDMVQLPLLAMRLLCRRASVGPREALSIALNEDDNSNASTQDGLFVLVPVLIRCAAALNLNMDALTLKLKDDSEAVDQVYATQYAHAQVLEAALQTCFHLLGGLRETGLSQYRNTELLNALLLLAERLSSSLVGLTPGLVGNDPEFRLLWRHCLVWVCRVFRAWMQAFPSATGGQLLQPLLRHARVLPWHFVPGFLLLATCGDLQGLLPSMQHSFTILQGKSAAEALAAAPGTSAAEAAAAGANNQSIQSHSVLVPASMRAGAPAQVILKTVVSEQDSSDKSAQNRMKVNGQFWGVDAEAQDWDVPGDGGGMAHVTNGMHDPLIRALSSKQQTAGVAMSLSLVGHVNARRERLTMDDLGELAAMVAQCAVTSDALLHLITVRVLAKLTNAGVPVLEAVLLLGEAALHGASNVISNSKQGLDLDQSGEGTANASAKNGEGGSAAAGAARSVVSPAGGAAKDPRDSRAVSRILMLLTRFGERGSKARLALAEQRAETLCLSVLAHSPSSLPPMAAAQAVRVLSLMFCSGGDAAKLQDPRSAQPGSPSVPKCRMVSKALSLLLNRVPEDGQMAGPTAMAAALELLLRLNSARSMCLNLLFSAEEVSAEGGVVGWPVPVTLSCAFRLGQCAHRLGAELAAADERWETTPRGTEGEVEAEENLASWLHVGELLVNLCQTVLVNCPTASVFLAVVLPGGLPPEKIDESVLKGVLADLDTVLIRITGRTQRAETVPLRAAALVGNLRALQRQLIDSKVDPPPTTLTREELCPPRHAIGANGASDSGAAAANDAAACDVLEEVVDLFEAANSLEGDSEWYSVADLDAADAPVDSARPDWEFDGAAHRKKRKQAIEKAEAERREKRLKQAPRIERQAQDSSRRRTSENEVPRSERNDKAPRRSAAATPSGSPTDRTSAATTSPPAAAGSKAPEASVSEVAAKAPAPAAAAPKAPAVMPDGAEIVALQSFLKDHPHFLRVVQNPGKCLKDPRVKTMFLAELKNYPLVQQFLNKKGLVLT